MALPVTIPNAFANATASIPLSQLDTNFNTLANAVNGISDGSETLANVTATVGNITTVNATTVDTTNVEVTNIKAKDGTAAVVLTDSTGAVAVSTPLTANGGVVFNEAGADVDFRVEGDTNANVLFVDASADAVGIGTSSPGQKLHVAGNIRTANCLIEDSSTNVNFGTTAAGYLAFLAGSGSERARITSGGELLVGKTTGAGATVGAQMESNGIIASTVGSGASTALYANRQDDDGVLVSLRKANTEVGTIGTVSGYVYLYGTASTGTGLAIGANTVYPCTSTGTVNDNTTDLGIASTARFNDAYITNGVTTGSDRNDKQDIEELTEAETRVAVACKALLRKWRWKDAVAKKGDDARIHFGIIAQDLKAAFEAEGLDAHRYAMFMWNEWWEKERIIPAVEGKEAVYETQTDEEGNETQVLVSEAVEAQPEKTVIDIFETEEEAGEGAVRKERMGIRYNELLAFIIAAI